MPSHRALLVALAVSTALAAMPSAPAEEAPFVGGVPRVGTSFLVTETYTYPDFGESWSWKTRYTWVGEPEPFVDGFRQDRWVSPVEVEYVEDFFGFTFTELMDVHSRQFVGAEGTASTPGDTRAGPLRVHQARGDPQTTYHFVYHHPALLLMGRTLAAGESFTVDPVSGSTPAGLWATTWRGVGWEEGQFHAQTVYEWQGSEFALDFWFAPGGLAPTRGGYDAFFDYGEGPVHEIYEIAVSEVVEGTGAPVAVDGYVEPTATQFPGDIDRATWTADGPDEDVLSTVPLPRAVAVARADARAQSWFAAHPDAFVSAATFEEDPFEAQVRWRIAFADGIERFTVAIVAPWVPGQLAGDPVVTTAGASTEPWADLDAEDFVGRELACIGHAEDAALAGAPDMGDDGVGALRRGRVGADLAAGAICSLTIERILNDNTFPGVVGLREEWPYAHAAVGGLNGGVVSEARGISHAERSVHVDA